MAKKKLSISMLVCGRDTTIRCLDSLVPILEGMDAELILVDTGCPAELREQLTKYTDQILSFTWCNDFSAARNVGLRAAKGEWFLYIDDDEWFENPEVLIEFFNSGKYKKYGCTNYIQRNFYDADFVHYDDFYVSRMMRLESDTRFESKIHEYLFPIRGEAINLPLIANHTGYIFQTPEDKIKHYERNSTLLYDMIKEEPDRLRWRVQLMQEFRAIKGYEQMYDFGLECLEYTKGFNSQRDNWDIGTFYAGAAEAKLFLKDYEESIRICNLAEADPRMVEMCHAYMNLCKATVYFELEKWSEAESCIRKYFKIEEELSKNEIRLANQKGALLVGEAFDVFPKQRAYSILCACELKRKETKNLKKYISKLGWDKNRVYVFDGFLAAVAEAMATMPITEEFLEVAQMAWNNAVVQPKFFIEIQAWEPKDENKFNQLLRIVSKLDGPQWYIHYARILVAGLDQNASILPEEFAAFIQSTSNVFLAPENIANILKKYRINQEDTYLSVPFEKWCAHLSEYLSRADYKDILVKKFEFETMRTKGNVRYEYLDVRMAEVTVLYSVRENDFSKKREALRFFMEKATGFLGRFYQKNVIEKEPELLPIYGQIAFKIRDALEIEDNDTKRALELYREIVMINSQWAEVMKSYMHALGVEKERRDRAAKEEMKKLEASVLVEVHKLVEAKQYEEALAVVKQLRQIKPNSLDLIELSLQIRLAILENA